MNLNDTVESIRELKQLNQSCYNLKFIDEQMYNKYNDRLHILEHQIPNGDKKTAEIFRMYWDYKTFEMALPDKQYSNFINMLESAYNGENNE